MVDQSFKVYKMKTESKDQNLMYVTTEDTLYEEFDKNIVNLFVIEWKCFHLIISIILKFQIFFPAIEN